MLCAAPNAPHRARNCGQYTQGDGWVQRRDRRTSCHVPSAATTAATAASTGSVVCHRPPVAGVSPTVQWLITKAEKDACYALFKAGRHHVLTNPGVVSSWQFAVEFSKKHSGMPSPVAQPTVGVLRRHLVLTRHLTTISPPPSQVGGRGRKRPPRIKKSEVQQALGIGSSWMSDAHRAMTLRWKFGEGGTSPHQDVIRVCTSTAEDDRMGARALLGYLAEQEH
jgi:uncharacterized membrane protein